MTLLAKLIFTGGLLQFSILLASVQVPFQLDWRKQFAPLSRLNRQLHWTYGGYIVLAIVAFGTISITCASEISAQTPLARAFCGYVSVFWFIRLGLQFVLDVKAHLTHWWLRWGYRLLTVLFAAIAGIYGWAAMVPR